MKSKSKRNITKFFLIAFATFCVLLAFFIFIKNNDKRATEISINALKDATTQSAQRVNEVLECAEHDIIMTSAIYTTMLENAEVSHEDLVVLTDVAPFDYIDFINSDGIEMNSDNETFDASDKAYYINGMAGETGISTEFNSQIGGENLAVFYTPQYSNDEIIGVLAGFFTEDQLNDVLATSLFGEDSKTLLCTKEGNVIASGTGAYISENIFQGGTFSALISTKYLDNLKTAFRTGENYSFQYDGSHGTGNGYTTVLDNNEDWVLIQTFPSGITSDFVSTANKAGIILLIELITIFFICLFVVQFTGYRQKKKLIAENADNAYVIDGIKPLFKTFIRVNLEKNTYKYISGTSPSREGIPSQGDCIELRKYLIELAEDKTDRDNLDAMLKKEALNQNFADGTDSIRYEYKSKCEGNKWDSLNVICMSRDENNNPKEILVTYQDVSKAKEGEHRSYLALKEAYQAVESANMAKSDFLSNMSHDIRTPMNAIMGMTAIAAINIDNPEKVKDCLNKITVSSQHLLGLINEVLDMSKIESGKLVLVEEEFNLSDVVECVVTMFLTQAEQKNQNFTVNITNIQHEDVIGDSMRLQQVLVNILSNAVKFTDIGGSIAFSICEKPSNMHGCGCYEFTFADTGIGMEPEFIDKIFEPFVRAKTSRTHNIEGTGLGMPIVNNIVQMMNGDIKIESMPNVGSTFVVTVYLKFDQSKMDDIQGLENLTVLVADDEQTACESACLILNEIGMVANWVLSGDEAIKALVEARQSKKDYSAVILDWKMPNKDGIETAREIRKQLGNDVPIIILSAYDYSEIEQQARDAGVNAFITKPLFKSRLVYVMKSLMLSPKQETYEVEQLQAQDFSGKRILLVEDNEINMEIAVELLSQTGVEIEKATNGQEAVEILNSTEPNHFNLVFMDIQMPVMNGYEATEAIRNSPREDLKTLPIIAMSADVFMDDVKHAKEVGMNGHVAKPVQIETLLSALEQWM